MDAIVQIHSHSIHITTVSIPVHDATLTFAALLFYLNIECFENYDNYNFLFLLVIILQVLFPLATLTFFSFPTAQFLFFLHPAWTFFFHDFIKA